MTGTEPIKTAKPAIAWTTLHGLAPVVILLVLGAAIWALHNELAQYTFAGIVANLRSFTSTQLALALAGAAISFLSWAGYDAIALLYAGKKIEPNRIAFASFSAYAVSNSLGFGLVTGNTVRYRLYSAWGLSAEEIGLVGATTGLTMALGAAILAGAGLILERAFFADLVSVPETLVSLLGIAFLVPPSAFMLWALFSKAPLKMGLLTIERPSSARAIAQIAVSLLDWAGAALVIYALLPAASPFGYFSFLPIFVFASLVGAFSGVPAGAGVFEAIILLLTPSGAEEGALAALIGYRAIYYVAPLILAAFMVGGREALLRSPKRETRPSPMLDFYLGMAPSVFALLAFLSGGMLLLSAATPSVPRRLAVLQHFLPLEVVEVSHFLSSIAGILLIVVAFGLRRRVDSAWLTSLMLLGASAVLALLKGGNIEQALILATIAATLAVSKPSFHRHGGLGAFRASAGWLAAAVAALGGAIWIGLFSYRHVEYTNELWWTFLINGDAPRFLRSMTGASLALIAIVLWRLFRHPPETQPDSAADFEKAVRIVPCAENAKTDSNLALLGDKQFLFSPAKDSFIMYARRGRTLIAVSEPVGRKDEARNLVWAFRELADSLGLTPVFYSIRKEFLPVVIDAGFVIQKIGETALVPLKTFSLEGPSRAKLRYAKKRLEREGLAFSILTPQEVGDSIEQLQKVSDDWLARHSGAEKSFTLGYFDRSYITRFPIAVVKRGEDIIAFANLWTTASKKEISLDLMRHSAAAPNGVMDGLFVDLILWSKAEGYEFVDLGLAPLSGLEARRLAPLFTRLGAYIFQHADAFYGFEGLREYKKKFDPIWEPVYMAVLGPALIPIAMGNVALLTSGGLKGLFGRRRPH